jgi:hypothetical protein
MSYGIGSAIASAANAQAIIDTIGNMNEWQAYARKLEARISELELELKENQDYGVDMWFSTMTRKALLTASQLWIQKFGEVPVSPDLNAVGKNGIENSVEMRDEAFLKLVNNILKVLVAQFSNKDFGDNRLYDRLERHGRKAVIKTLQSETRAEKWKIEKILEEAPLSPADREMAIVKKVGGTDPFSVLGPLAEEML